MIYTSEINISNCSRQTTMLDAFRFYFFPHTYMYRPSLQLCVASLPCNGLDHYCKRSELFNSVWYPLCPLCLAVGFPGCCLHTDTSLQGSGCSWFSHWNSCAAWSGLGGDRSTMTSISPVWLLLLPLWGLFFSSLQ